MNSANRPIKILKRPSNIMRFELTKCRLAMLTFGQQKVFNMRYFYVVETNGVGDAAIDEVVVLMSQQARISTRRRSERWELRVHGTSVSIKFLHKYDRDDFLTAFDPANKEFLARHSLICVGAQAYPTWLDRVAIFLLLDRASK